MRTTQAINRRLEADLDALCRTLVHELSLLAQNGGDQAAVVALFGQLARPPHLTRHRLALLGDAFQRLDERPTWYGNGAHCQDWHALLRQTRNSLVHGPALFANWREAE